MHEPYDRFAINRSKNQFVFIPSVGIVYYNYYFRFLVAFMWLNIQFRIGFFRK